MNAPFPPVIAQCDRGRFLAFLRQQGEIPVANEQEKSPITDETREKIVGRIAQNLPDQTPNEWIKGQNGRWMAIQGTND